MRPKHKATRSVALITDRSVACFYFVQLFLWFSSLCSLKHPPFSERTGLSDNLLVKVPQSRVITHPGFIEEGLAFSVSERFQREGVVCPAHLHVEMSHLLCDRLYESRSG